MRDDIVIIGGGLAGSEAAWQAANRGAKVTLYEMRPKEMTQAHTSEAPRKEMKSGGIVGTAFWRCQGNFAPHNTVSRLIRFTTPC